jgi:hypothetical protein
MLVAINGHRVYLLDDDVFLVPKSSSFGVSLVPMPVLRMQAATIAFGGSLTKDHPGWCRVVPLPANPQTS